MYTPCEVCVKHIQAEVIISIFTLFSASESETKSRALSVMLHCHAITEIHNNGKILLSELNFRRASIQNSVANFNRKSLGKNCGTYQAGRLEMSRGEQTRTSVQWAEHTQEAEPGSSWLLGACTLVVAVHNVSTLQSNKYK